MCKTCGTIGSNKLKNRKSPTERSGIFFDGKRLHFRRGCGILCITAVLRRENKPGCGLMVGRLLWEQDFAGSIPVTPTMMSIHNGLDVMNTHFLYGLKQIYFYFNFGIE